MADRSMTPHAVWKGFLKFGSVAYAVKLFGATSESEKLHFPTLNRKDKLPVKSAYIVESTGKTVESDDIIKGYELVAGDFLHLAPDKIKALKLQSEHTPDSDGSLTKRRSIRSTSTDLITSFPATRLRLKPTPYFVWL
jgi:DNA end-binding protein Ku